MTDHATTVDTHLAGYCEPDANWRAELLGRVWADDGVLLDPPLEGTGPAGIAALVDAVLAHYPNHRFERTTELDAHHDRARYGWALVAPDGTPSSAPTSRSSVMTESSARSSASSASCRPRWRRRDSAGAGFRSRHGRYWYHPSPTDSIRPSY
jgi:hypothetical protein